MKSSELLKMARERLWDGVSVKKTTQFICIALDLAQIDASYDDHTANTMTERLQDIVECCIGRSPTMENFLATQLGIGVYDLTNVMTSAEIQQKRFELVDKLIAEYEEKGD